MMVAMEVVVEDLWIGILAMRIPASMPEVLLELMLGPGVGEALPDYLKNVFELVLVMGFDHFLGSFSVIYGRVLVSTPLALTSAKLDSVILSR
jgi:hypothetical protein